MKQDAETALLIIVCVLLVGLIIYLLRKEPFKL